MLKQKLIIQNSGCRFGPIISEYSEISQREYKTRHDWVGKVIHWKLCKRFKFEHTTKRCLHKPELVVENKTHKIPWDFVIQMDPLITTMRQDQVLINKKKIERAMS